jgi:hypothetical protein
METYRKQNFQGKSFILEEAVFLDCKLIDCDLYYSGGEFDFPNTTLENCRFHFREAAKNTAALMHLLQAMGQQKPPVAFPVPPGPKVN